MDSRFDTKRMLAELYGTVPTRDTDAEYGALTASMDRATKLQNEWKEVLLVKNKEMCEAARDLSSTIRALEGVRSELNKRAEDLDERIASAKAVRDALFAERLELSDALHACHANGFSA